MGRLKFFSVGLLIISALLPQNSAKVTEYALHGPGDHVITPDLLPTEDECPFNLKRCSQGFSLSFHAKRLQLLPTAGFRYLLSTGGQSPLGNGLYVRENYGQELEAAVASGDRIWKALFNVSTMEWFHFIMTWSNDGTLSVYVDGKQVEADVITSTRPVVSTIYDPFKGLGIGKSNDDISTGADNFAMYNVAFEDKIWTKEEVVTKTEKPAMGCLAALPEGLQSMTTDGEGGCRTMCGQQAKRLYYFNTPNKCLCLPDTYSHAGALKHECSNTDYEVKSISAELSVPTGIKLEVKVSKSEVVTGENVKISMTTDSSEDVYYKIVFGDTARITVADSVYYSWDAPGDYNVYVEAKSRTLSTSHSFMVQVKEKDPGVPPEIIGLQTTQELESPKVEFIVTTSGSGPIDCTVYFGNHKDEKFVVEESGVKTTELEVTYDLAGFYDASVECTNTRGSDSAETSVQVHDTVVHTEVWDSSRDYVFMIHGAVDMINNIKVKMGDEVEFHRENNSVVLSHEVFAGAGDYAVEVYTGSGYQKLLRQGLVHVQSKGAVESFQVVPKHGKITDSFSLQAAISADPFFMEINTESNHQFFYGRGNGPTILEHVFPNHYEKIGMKDTTLTLCNAIWCGIETGSVSVETPIHQVKFIPTDVYSVDDEVRFQISPNLISRDMVDRLNVHIKYGDGSEESKVLTAKTNEYTEFTLWHKYPHYSFFHGSATFSNNLTSVEKTFSLQVGENLTFVDLFTETERLNMAVSSEAVIRAYCPTGSSRRYGFHLGDGTYIEYPETETSQVIIPEGGSKPRFEVINDGDIKVRHSYFRPDHYTVRVTVKNEFGAVESTLCPEIIVANPPPAKPACENPKVSFENVPDLSERMEKAYSENITLNMITLSECSDNKTARYTWKIQRKGVSGLIRPQEPCIFRSGNPQLYLEPFRLQYGEYWITGCAELSLSELYYSCLTINVRISASPLRAVIKGGERSDVTMPAPIIIDMQGSGDPDVRAPLKDESRFYLICYRNASKNRLQELGTNIEDVKRQSSEVVEVDDTVFFDFEESCFDGADVKDKGLTLMDHILTVPEHVYVEPSDYFFRLITIKFERNAVLDHKTVIWDPSAISVDNFDEGALDDLLEKDVSGALFLITATAGNLNELEDKEAEVSEEELEERKVKAMEIRTKMIDSLKKVAGGKAENPTQVIGCAKALTTVTSKSDEVTQEAKDGAAKALEDVGGMTGGDIMKDTDVTQVADVTGSLVDGASNLLPGKLSAEEAYQLYMKQDERKERSKRRKRRALGEKLELMVEESEVSQDACGVDDADWAIMKMPDKQACPWIHPYYTHRLADQRREEKRLKMLSIKEANKKITKKCTGATKGVAGALLGKQKEGDNMEFSSPNLDMKVRKPKPGEKQAPLLSQSGGIEAPDGVNPGAGMMFAAMPNNPFEADDGESGVTSGVVSLDMMGPDGKPLSVKDTKEPFRIEVPNKNVSKPLEFGMYTSIDADKKNFHSINITKKDQHMRLFIKPDDLQDVIQVCYNLTLQPNATYPGFCKRIPKTEAPPHNLDPALVDKWRHTLHIPFNMTKNDNVTLKLSIKLIGARVIMPIQERYHNYSFLSYNLACRYYNETEEKWMDNGCTLSVNSTEEKTICHCTHLTAFGGDFVVPPNTIDFSTVWAKFAKLNENAAVFSTVITILGLYLIALVWCRYKDKKDLVKWGAQPLEDNLPSDSYHYQIAVHTGMRKGASTRSRVSFVLSGDDGDTGVRELYDGNRKEFTRGSVMNFVLSVEQRLGPLTFLRIWHDNKGKGKFKSWYLDHIQVNDLQTGERYFFISNRWLAVEEDDGMVERIVPVAGYDDMASFSQLFNTSVKKKLTNDHIWFSIVSRPTRSSFTRVQRLSCCLSLLFLTMITSCMWFKTGDKPEQPKTAVSLGPFSFTLQELFISVMSTLIVFPVNLFMVSVFRKVKAKKNTVAQSNQQVNKSKKQRWRRIDPDSALWTGQQKTRTQKFKDSLKNIVTFHRNDTNKYSNQEKQVFNKKKKPFLFPYWMLYVAYIMCFLSVVASAFFTILYSMEWGAELANKWLATFVLSFFENVIIVQPVKVLLLAAFISFIMRKPELDDEQDFLDETMNNVPEPGEETHRSTVDLEKIVLQRKTAASHLRPPDMESLRAARETRLMELKMEDIMKEMSAYMFFVLILFFISYQTRSRASYQMGAVVKTLFTEDFSMVNNHQKFYDYMNKYFIPNLYPLEYYNGEALKWREKICINDGSYYNVRVGVPRIRQMRIKPNSCKVLTELRGMIKHCRDAYNWMDDDTKPYLEGWVTPPEANVTALKKTISPWVYRSSLKLKNEPYMATVSFYKGGGYSMDLGIRRKDTQAMMDSLYESNWLDTKTRAVFLEFTLYNANVNLFTSVRMTAEFISTGSAVTRTEYKVFRLYSYVGGFGVVVLTAEIIFIIFFLYFFYREVKRLKNERLLYFKNFWNLLEFMTMVGSIVAISMYIMKKLMAELAMNALRESGSSEFVNFNTIALWDELYAALLAALVFIATVKIIKILKFNRRMGILGSTIKRAGKDLKVFSIAFLIYFLAFCQLAYLLFGRQLATYENFIGACESMFAMALGDFAFDDMQGAQRYLGPIFFFLYIGIVYFVLMGIFLTIINDAFAEVKANADLQSNDFELVDFMLRRFKGMFGCVGRGTPDKNGDEESDDEENDTESVKSSKL